MQSSNLSTGSGGMDFSLQGFEKTLDAKTIKYLNAKTKTMDKVDLRQLSDDVRLAAPQKIDTKLNDTLLTKEKQ